MYAEGFFTCFQGARSRSEEQTTCSTWQGPLGLLSINLHVCHVRQAHVEVVTTLPLRETSRCAR